MSYPWFPSFDAVPGVSWQPLMGVARSNLMGSQADQLRKLETDRELTPPMIADTISEALAMQGTRRDYHFGMLAAWRALYRKRRDDPRALAWVETLCLADINLMERGPQLVFIDRSDLEPARLAQPAFAKLSDLYQREGFLAAAVDIEKRYAALGAGRVVGEAAVARQVVLLEEDGR